MKLLPSFLWALMTAVTPAAAQDGTPKPVLLACESAAGENFTIELFSESTFGPLHCVTGLTIVDMTPCAPDKGWGLSYPTGSAGLADVTNSWSVASQHFGGKFTAALGPETFNAIASFGDGLEPDLTKGSYDMTLTLDRSTGAGSYISGELGKVVFQCSIKPRKF